MKNMAATITALGLLTAMLATPALACPGDKDCDGSKCKEGKSECKHAKHHKHDKGADKTTDKGTDKKSGSDAGDAKSDTKKD